MGLNKSTLTGHLACFGAYCIFGFNIVCCKNISNANVLTPMDLFCLRATGAAILFWLLSFSMPKEKVPLKDLLQIFVASMLGLFLTQMSFLKAITMTTSIDLSIANTCTPIMTMFVAAIVLKEPITFKKAGGVLVSLVGVLILIFNSVGLGGGASETKPLGIVLTVLNGLTFALYLGIFRPLISKYNVVTFMKWMFLFSMLVALPLNAKSFFRLPFGQMENKVLWQVAYVVVFATFVAYFLIPVGQKRLRPTLVSMYNYVQPIIATLISIIIGLDHLTWKKLVAMALVFMGVWIVNQSRAAEPVQQSQEK
jgi:drug/metabolite transporter (DMT)-like permease